MRPPVNGRRQLPSADGLPQEVDPPVETAARPGWFRRLFARLRGRRRSAAGRAIVSGALGMGGRYISGEASAKHAGASRDYAEAAKATLSNELSERTLESEVRLREALAYKAEWDARKARAEALEAEFRLRKTAETDRSE